jgi:carboxyl-terminal processing protease
MKLIKYLIKTIFVICVIFLISCNPQKKYINEALDIIETHSMKKDLIDWSDFRSKVLKNGKDDKTIEDAHKTIWYALLLLNDGHSFLVTSQDLKKEFSDTSMKKIEAIESHYENEIGYIKIPGFIGNDALTKAFADRLQYIIKDFDQHNLNGWIIDLRDNKGGNMWPMLLGIGPIIGEGTAGYFVNNKNVFNSWGYYEGKTFVGGSIISKLDNIYQLKNVNKKIAVLINNNTASSGEAIAVAFKGLPKTRFFGNKTRGQTTANSTFYLSDSSMIALMVGVYADRNKTLYGKQIIPDEIVKGGDAKEIATNWINWRVIK